MGCGASTVSPQRSPQSVKPETDPQLERNVISVSLRQAIYNKLEVWQKLHTPIPISEVLGLFVDFSRKTKLVHSVITFGGDEGPTTLVKLLFTVRGRAKCEEVYTHLLACFEPMLLHHIKRETNDTFRLSLFLETKESFQFAIEDMLRSGVTARDVHRIVLLDKSDTVADELTVMLSNIPEFNVTKKEDVAPLIKYHIDRYVELFDLSSVHHSNVDRFKYFSELSLAHYHLVNLYYILSDRAVSKDPPQLDSYFLASHPVQAYSRVGKAVGRHLGHIEPTSHALAMPSTNDNMKEQITQFVSVVCALEKKYGENYGAGEIQTLLTLIMLRDYFPNFRDISSIMKTGAFFRSSSLHNYTEQELTLLFDKAGIQSVIDLRAIDEAKSKGYCMTPEGEIRLNRSNGKVDYYSVAIKPWTVKKVPQDISPIFRYVHQFTEDTSYGFYEIFPRYFHREIFRVFDILKDARYPILIHCNLGKDRTGCIVALFQEFVGYSSKEIISEYMLSGRGSFAKNIQAFMDVITEYGGAEKYLTMIGFTSEELAEMKAQFTEMV